VTQPEGTYLGWLDFRAHFASAGELRKFLVQEAGVGLNPGDDFGKSGVGFARINFATQRSVLIEALTRIEAAMARQIKMDQ